jgi:hypothetical protein
VARVRRVARSRLAARYAAGEERLISIAARATSVKDSVWDPVVVAAVITAGFAIVSWVLNAITTAIREDRGRRRDSFSKAFAAIVAYAEFPYVVRRRDPRKEVDERIRISEALRGIQQEIAYYEAWLSGESRAVGAAYAELVGATRRIAGRAIHEAWLAQPVANDPEMNMPDLGLGALWHTRQQYLETVARNVRPIRWLMEKSTARRRHPQDRPDGHPG